MKNLQQTAKKLYHYRWATATEARTLYKILMHDRSVNQWKYKKRYVEGANPQRPAYLRFSSPTFLDDKTPRDSRMFHEGLLQDQEGIYWIVKKFNPRAREDQQPREPRNSPRFEMLAYLLAQGRANYAEIRFLRDGEMRNPSQLGHPLRDYYLTRVVTSRNLKPADLPHHNLADAFAAIFVANIFMRKWDQHLSNFAYVGEIPVSIDHDVIGPPLTFPHSPAGWATFGLAFLSFKLVATMSHLQPPHSVDARAKERFRYNFVRQNHREAWGIMREIIQDLGLGAGLIKAEGLGSARVRQSITAFKSIDGIGPLAVHAGFRNPELDIIVRYLTDSQKNLGHDVGHLWRRVSGGNVSFDELD